MLRSPRDDEVESLLPSHRDEEVESLFPGWGDEEVESLLPSRRDEEVESLLPSHQDEEEETETPDQTAIESLLPDDQRHEEVGVWCICPTALALFACSYLIASRRSACSQPPPRARTQHFLGGVAFAESGVLSAETGRGESNLAKSPGS